MSHFIRLICITCLCSFVLGGCAAQQAAIQDHKDHQDHQDYKAEAH